MILNPSSEESVELLREENVRGSAEPPRERKRTPSKIQKLKRCYTQSDHILLKDLNDQTKNWSVVKTSSIKKLNKNNSEKTFHVHVCTCSLYTTTKFDVCLNKMSEFFNNLCAFLYWMTSRKTHQCLEDMIFDSDSCEEEKHLKIC